MIGKVLKVGRKVKNVVVNFIQKEAKEVKEFRESGKTEEKKK
jgi:hypothetical protein